MIFLILRFLRFLVLSLLFLFGLVIVNILPVITFIFQFYRLTCFLKLVTEWFPMLNRSPWYMQLLDLLTEPFFDLCIAYLPSIRIKDNYLDLSVIIGIELLNLVVTTCIAIVNQVANWLFMIISPFLSHIFLV